MPELPEVEIIRRGLEQLAVGRAIAEVSCSEPRSFPGFSPSVASTIIGTAITTIDRRGKLLIAHLDNGYSLLIHLRMTGQLVFRPAKKRLQATREQDPFASNADDGSFGGGHPNASLIRDLPDKTTRVIFRFSDDSQLYFNDQRKFGSIRMVPRSEVADDSFMQRLGPEPLLEDFTWQELKDRLPLNSRQPVKAALLDQSVIAGIGNIYADESLFGAGIHPLRPVLSLSDNDIERLHESIRCCLQQSIDDGGSTARNYVDSQGMRGEYLDLHAKVFNRKGQTCCRCGHTIEKTRVAGRGTHICPRCQK